MPSSSDNPNHYEILGIPTTASFEEIKQAFRQLANSYHPDRSVGKSDAVRKFAEDKFKEIIQAYEVLKDPQARQDYDRQLQTSTTELKKQELIRQIQELYEGKNLESAVDLAKILFEQLTDDLDCQNIYAGLAYELAIQLVETEQLDRAESYLMLALSIGKNEDFKQQVKADLRLLKSKKEREEEEKKAAADRERIEAERHRKAEKLRREEAYAERRRKSEEEMHRTAAYKWVAEEKSPELKWEDFKYVSGVISPIIYKSLVAFFVTLIISLIVLWGFGIAVEALMSIVENIPSSMLLGTGGIVASLIGSIIYSLNTRSFKPLLLFLVVLVLITFIGSAIFLTVSIIRSIIEVYASIYPLARIAIGAVLLLIGITLGRK